METLRDKVSSLSRELAMVQGEEGADSTRAPSISSRQADVAKSHQTRDASVHHEMQELRRELCEAQAALEAQIPLVCASNRNV